MTAKRKHRLARGILKQFKVSIAFSTGGDNKCHFVHAKTGKKLRTVPELIAAAENTQHKWSVLMAGLCRKADGEEYMKSEQITVPEPIYQSKLCDALNEHHQRLIEQCNPNHLVGAAWIASPYGLDFDEGMAAKIFDNLGGWKPERMELS